MTFWKDVWEDIEPAARALIGDIAIFLIVLMALVVVYGGLHGLEILGFDPTRLERFETIHYWAYLVVFAMLLFDLILKVGVRVYQSGLRIARVNAPDEN